MDAPFSARVPRYDKKAWIIALSVALLTVLVYLPALQNDFVNWDDDIHVYENDRIQSIDFKSLKWMFISYTYAGNWYPLTWLSYAIDYSLWGLNPMGYHLTNIIFHGLNTFFVVLIIMRLIEIAGVKETPFFTPEQDRLQIRALTTAAVTGFLFGLHPLHVESVAWVSERKDVLYAFFFLLSIFSYLKYKAPSAQKKKTLYYALCLIFFVFSLMSKPMAVTLP